jgi:hypothetical protein
MRTLSHGWHRSHSALPQDAIDGAKLGKPHAAPARLDSPARNPRRFYPTFCPCWTISFSFSSHNPTFPTFILFFELLSSVEGSS